ncbi:hypothetical protein LSAT2_005831 [Lamellibrachia satsuma]|nr:hypothetical protein LSAT2_005831 [Lamellibrachia satsuma]
MVGMSDTPTSTRDVSRPMKRSGSSEPSGSSLSRKKLLISVSCCSNTSMDDVSPSKHATPSTDSKKTKQDTNEGADADGNKKRKSMRRSSFVRGRISMAMPVTSTPQLSSNIPQDLPEDERLVKLSMSVLEHTLEKLGVEFSSLEGMQQFKVLARDAVDRTVQTLKEDGTLASLTVADNHAPNPVNAELESTITTYEKYIEKLKTESQGWDSLVELRRQMAEDAERAEATAADDIIMEPVAPLSVEQETFLNKKPNYIGLLDELNSFRKQALFAANEILEGTKVMDQLMEIASVVVQEQAHLLHVHSFESIKNFDSPRTLLGNVE